MSGGSFWSLHIVAFSLRSDSSKSKGSPFVLFVLLHSLLETKETNLKGQCLDISSPQSELNQSTLKIIWEVNANTGFTLFRF